MNDVMSLPSFLERLATIVGAANVLTDLEETAPALSDWRGNYSGRAIGIVRASNTMEVAAVVELCVATRTPIVTQGGNTGMCGAAIPTMQGDAIVLSLSRMNRILALDIFNNTITVEAGCILANVQQAAADVGRFFPLSLAAEGSCQIGGNLATNAGGINVLRYGNMRDLTLGLEVVLPDGRIWRALRGLRKDNTGYDLKHIFIGSEGTLGVITSAVLKLFPQPRTSATAFAAVPSPEAAIALLAHLRDEIGECISAFEIISCHCVELVVKHIPGVRSPLNASSPWFVLTNVDDFSAGTDLREALEQALASAIDKALITDVVLAENIAHGHAFWRLRESIPEAAKSDGLLYRHDISVPISDIPGFIKEADSYLEKRFPGVRIICFGHIGDGNLHYNCFAPCRSNDDSVAITAKEVNDAIYKIVYKHGGSISAEHGVGQAKQTELPHYKSVVEMELMRTVKKALDPLGIMNPGKVL